MVLVTRLGYALRFSEDQVRHMGRASRGVLGLRLSKEDELAGAVCVREGEQMF